MIAAAKEKNRLLWLLLAFVVSLDWRLWYNVTRKRYGVQVAGDAGDRLSYGLRDGDGKSSTIDAHDALALLTAFFKALR